MNIVWIVNCVLPEVNSLGGGYQVNRNAGWLESQLEFLKEFGDNVTVIATTSEQLKRIECVKIGNVTYYIFPEKENTLEQKMEMFKRNLIMLDLRPDLVHVHGTEKYTSLIALEVFGEQKCIISIQGLIEQCRIMYMKNFEITMPKTIFSKILPSFPFTKRAIGLMEEAVKNEQEIIKKGRHFIGRTEWDYAQLKIQKSDFHYFHCNETLRNSFYTSRKWEYEKCEKYSIFITQSMSPIKGFDSLLLALSKVVKRFPNIKVYVASGRYEKRSGIKGKILQNILEWNNQINYLIEEYNLRDKIVFLGGLNTTDMIEYYLKCNVFVSPSRIENESNSLSEAKILGVPSIASYVGGMTERIEHGNDGFLYNFMDYNMLAFYIEKIFEDENLAKKISRNAILNNEKINNRELNKQQLRNIYQNVLEIAK